MQKNRVLTLPLPCFQVKVKGRGQGQRSRLIFLCAAVDIRGSALPSAVKSNKNHCQSKVFVCVSIINQHMRIIARMRSIGIKFFKILDAFPFAKRSAQKRGYQNSTKSDNVLL